MDQEYGAVENAISIALEPEVAIPAPEETGIAETGNEAGDDLSTPLGK